MRHIKKSTIYSERHLDKAALTPPTNSDEAKRAWKKLNKDTLYNNLFEEQYGLCAYTELNIQDFKQTQNSFKGAHIEHVYPKSLRPAWTFNYRNLVLSALDSEDLNRFDKAKRFGGHHKLNSFDAELFLSPLLPNISNYFSFSSEDGEIFPNLTLDQDDKNKAKYTIDLLNLNAPYLKNARKNWLQELQNEINKLIEMESIEGLEQLAKCELTLYRRNYSLINRPTSQLRQFHSASLNLFNDLGKRVLAGSYPQGL
tara:strand:+ start:542 stop:1309 length:768 start_codon:yes stop_codon:yes gene_type:complete